MQKPIAVIAMSMMVAVGGCASTAQPTAYAGKYYMTGDKDCKSYSPAVGDTIYCYNSKGRIVASRAPLTRQDLQFYAARQAQQRAEIAALTEQLRDTGNSFNQITQNYQAMSQSYQPPKVQPVGKQGIDWWYCRDATDRIIICHN